MPSTSPLDALSAQPALSKYELSGGPYRSLSSDEYRTAVDEGWFSEVPTGGTGFSLGGGGNQSGGEGSGGIDLGGAAGIGAGLGLASLGAKALDFLPGFGGEEALGGVGEFLSDPLTKIKGWMNTSTVKSSLETLGYGADAVHPSTVSVLAEQGYTTPQQISAFADSMNAGNLAVETMTANLMSQGAPAATAQAMAESAAALNISAPAAANVAASITPAGLQFLPAGVDAAIAGGAQATVTSLSQLANAAVLPVAGIMGLYAYSKSQQGHDAKAQETQGNKAEELALTGNNPERLRTFLGLSSDFEDQSRKHRTSTAVLESRLRKAGKTFADLPQASQDIIKEAQELEAKEEGVKQGAAETRVRQSWTDEGSLSQNVRQFRGQGMSWSQIEDRLVNSGGS